MLRSPLLPPSWTVPRPGGRCAQGRDVPLRPAGGGAGRALGGAGRGGMAAAPGRCGGAPFPPPQAASEGGGSRGPGLLLLLFLLLLFLLFLLLCLGESITRVFVKNMFNNKNKKASAYLVQSTSLFGFPYFVLPTRAPPKKTREGLVSRVAWAPNLGLGWGRKEMCCPLYYFRTPRCDR